MKDNKTEIFYQDGLYGLKDNKGNVVLPAEYDELEGCFNNSIFDAPECYIAKKNGKMGIVGKDGNIILPIEYERLKGIVDDNFVGVSHILAKKNGKFGIVGKGGNIILPIEYNELKDIIGNNFSYIAKKNDKYGIVGKDGSIILPVEYDSIRDDDTDYLIVEKGNKRGLATKHGNIILPVKYDEYYCAPEGFFIVIDNGKKGIALPNGNLLTDCIYDTISFDSLTINLSDDKIIKFLTIPFFAIMMKEGEYSMIRIEHTFNINFENHAKTVDWMTSFEDNNKEHIEYETEMMILPHDENGVYLPDGHTLLLFLNRNPVIQPTVKSCRKIKNRNAIDTIVFAEGHTKLDYSWDFDEWECVDHDPCLKEIVLPSTIKEIHKDFFSQAFPRIIVTKGMLDYFKKIVPERLKDNVVEQE